MKSLPMFSVISLPLGQLYVCPSACKITPKAMGKISWYKTEHAPNAYSIGCSVTVLLISVIEAETKWPPFSRWHYQMDFFNENVRILIKISIKFLPNVPIKYIPSLVQIIAWRHPGDKPLSEPMMVNLLTHICVTRPQWVKKKISKLHRNCCINDKGLVWNQLTCLILCNFPYLMT